MCFCHATASVTFNKWLSLRKLINGKVSSAKSQNPRLFNSSFEYSEHSKVGIKMETHQNAAYHQYNCSIKLNGNAWYIYIFLDWGIAQHCFVTQPCSCTRVKPPRIALPTAAELGLVRWKLHDLWGVSTSSYFTPASFHLYPSSPMHLSTSAPVAELVLILPHQSYLTWEQTV